MKRIYITTGDPDGIGLEVTAKALFKIGPQKEVQFVIFRSSYKAKKWIELIEKKFKRKEVNKFNSNLTTCSSTLIDVNSSEPAPLWFKQSIKLCLKNPHHKIVTGPLSKASFYEANLKVMGHTGLLKSVTKKKNLFMAFKGQYFNVLLATDHVPLSIVSKKLSLEHLKKAVDAAKVFKASLSQKLAHKPIAFVGLNPHAGDRGLIGKEELLKLTPFLEKFDKKEIIGPLVPDAAFLKENWNKYSLYICLYHDQGLIPFKAIHGQDSGAHITIGLPFTRVSVDHGTAKDIFNKNKANPSSMIEAIEYALTSN
ncbi:MAG: 4-hydroxythreonine-4-phosphate dehydrogenase PdxA [Bdellovibrionales bacterium]|nr:4-hydroxythreonine-4-phosphate dehydrogenase PdxA [Bdellovibrionales bacterium]